MTYTAMGRCPDTGAIGVAVTTGSVNCGRVLPHTKGLLPVLRDDGAIVCSQSMCNPLIAYRALDHLDQGGSLDDLEAVLAEADEHLDRRQVGVVTAKGEAWAYTGEKCLEAKGHFVGDGYLVMGNVVTEECVPAMREAYEAGAGQNPAERLLVTLEAGRRAGGQRFEDGRPIPELFCSLYVCDGRHPYPAVDLRVDFDPSALEKMRRLYDNLMAGGHHDRFFETFYSRPDEWSDDLIAYAFELARKQV
jgi:uncharacterized Ntn-hydrolase superfamily protein